jgi:transposase
MMRRRSDLPPADPQPWSELIPADSFYARLAKWRDVLVNDEDYAPLYKDSPKGRPSVPPSTVVLTMLLEYYDDCSDAEAEQRMRFDLRWKHALGIGIEDEGFDSTVLCRFRRKLLDRGLQRASFERLVNAAREAGLITKDAAQLIDSSHVLGAAGARDTYALIRGGIRKLLRSLGYTAARKVELGQRLWWYFDPDAPEKPDIDWSDAETRADHLSRRSSETPGRRFRWRSAPARPPRPMKPPRCSKRSSPTMSKRNRLRVQSGKVARPKRRKRGTGWDLRSKIAPLPRIPLPGCVGV